MVNQFAHLLPPSWESIITNWIHEDIPSFDYGGYVVGEAPTVAILWAKSNGVIAGVPFVTEVFKQVHCRIDWEYEDGDFIGLERGVKKRKIATVTGPARFILIGERLALNILARCSGIASSATALKAQVEATGWDGILAGTRKTTPGFRIVEKYAMIVAGIDPHRYDLSSMCMLKDNHIVSKGSITEAVKAAKRVCGFSVKIHVECNSLDEAIEATTAGADIIMLDNFSPKEASAASITLTGIFSTMGTRRPLIEVSGGLNADNVDEFCLPGIDILSSSSVHQGAKVLDFSLKVQPLV